MAWLWRHLLPTYLSSDFSLHHMSYIRRRNENQWYCKKKVSHDSWFMIQVSWKFSHNSFATLRNIVRNRRRGTKIFLFQSQAKFERRRMEMGVPQYDNRRTEKKSKAWTDPDQFKESELPTWRISLRCSTLGIGATLGSRSAIPLTVKQVCSFENSTRSAGMKYVVIRGT